MGIFSSKKKTNVFIATQRMLEDSDFHSSKDYAMKEILFSDKHLDFVETITNYQNNSMPRKFKRIQAFAKAPDGYVFGLPTTAKLADKKKSLTDLLVAYLSTQEGSTVSLIYNVLGDKDFTHYAWLKLVSNYGYNGKTNELTVLSAQKGTPCYLYTGKITYSERSDKEYEIIRINNGGLLGFDYGQCFNRAKDMRKIASYEVGTTDKFVFSYQYKNASGVVTESITVDMSDVNPLPQTEKYWDNDSHSYETRTIYENEPDFIQAAYLVNGEVKFYTYQYLSGNLALDNNIDFDDGMGTYFPRLYLRIDKKDMVDSQDAKYKAHTKKFCRALGLDLEDITKQVKEGIGDNLGNTRDIYISLVARPNEDMNDQIIAKYLYNYFEDLYQASVKEYGDYKRRPISLDVSDNVASQSVTCNGILKRVNTGVAKNKDKVSLKKGEYCITRFLDTESENGDKVNAFKILKRGWAHSFTYQIADDKYISINVYNLESKANVKGHTATVSNDSDELFVPLDIRVVNELSQKDKEYLFHKCLHVQITLLKVTKVKWYQKGVFKIVLSVVGLAISILAPGPGTSLGVALINMAVGAAVGFAISLIMNLVIKLAIKLGMRPELAAALATLIEVGIAIYSKGTKLGNFLKADTLMQQLNMAFGNYQRAVNLKLQQIQSEISKLNKYYSDKEKQLKELKEALLSHNIPLSLDTLMEKETTRTYDEVNLGESPEDFYNRTMFYDITDVDIEFINNFAEITTQLPSFKELNNNYKQKQEEELDIQSGLLV